MKKNLLRIGQILGVFALACTGNLWSQTQTFEFTGGIQSYTVPCGVDSIYIQAWGAQGGSGAEGGASVAGGQGGLGGYAEGYLVVTPGDILNIFVGGQGSTPTGGFNGGANGGSDNAGGGGGASDVRVGGNSESDRILTAGGGGGGGRAGCDEGSAATGGLGGNGGSGGAGVGASGNDSPTSGGAAGGGQGGNFGSVVGASGPAGDGCGGFLGSPGGAASTGSGANGGAGQSCCCSSSNSIPGGGGGGGGQIGGGGGGGGSAGTSGCSGNSKGAGGGGGGGSNYFGGVTAGTDSVGVHSGNGIIVISWADPTPTIASITGPEEMCASETITITSTQSINATTYDWTVTGDLSIVSGQGTPTITVTGNAGSGTVFVHGTNVCASGANSDTIMVTIFALPTVEANTTESAVCTGESVTLTGSGTDDYVWDNGVSNGVAFEPAATTTYTVTATDTNGCENTDAITVTVNLLPVVSLSSSPAGIVCQGETAALTGNPVGGSLNILSGTGGTLTGNNFSSVAFGNFVLGYEFTDGNGCMSSDTVHIEVGCQGLDINAANSPVSIYPNPAQGSFQLIGNSALNGKIELYDDAGKRVLTAELSNVTKKQIDVNGLAPGVYNVRILNGQEQFTGKVTIIK
jgi:hypothetical protein